MINSIDTNSGDSAELALGSQLRVHPAATFSARRVAHTSQASRLWTRALLGTGATWGELGGLGPA